MKNTSFLFLAIIIMALTLTHKVWAKYEYHQTIDGDTLKVVQDGNVESLRIRKIDCFETKKNARIKKQIKNFNLTEQEVITKGIEARNAVMLIFTQNTEFEIIIDGRDFYRRLLGDIQFKDGTFLSDKLLNGKYCEKYK